ncbi:MAG: 16S rRNA (uracil(1498)-N(3))-methyltransferase [Verrucomicrobia bacterium]|nr:16S rRNA (uracil(1498)-N(3))-methyltransferase [Verrucomicrobiota bacterium]MDE3098137.1 16S rRNA (uracil(1498)-N(3))-methyltransferase [Verrucomicrobiota bacterium]
MHRFHLPSPAAHGLLRLEGREAHHALHVLRLKLGDEAVVLDGAGGQIFCRVQETGRDSLSLRVVRRDFVPPPPCAVTLLVAVPKAKAMDGIIQKSVELGVRRIVPLLTERVVTKLAGREAENKRGKWRQVAIEAIKQSGAAWLPDVTAPATLSEALAQNQPFELAVAGSLQTERRHPRDVFREFEKSKGQPPKTAAVWIGPEGDFTLDELQAIQSSGAQPISLGRLVLRVETAAVFCLSILNYEFNGLPGAAAFR